MCVYICNIAIDTAKFLSEAWVVLHVLSITVWSKFDCQEGLTILNNEKMITTWAYE